MARNARVLSLLAIALLVWTACACSRAPRRAPPRAVDGVLDLRDWNFESDGAVELNGVWDFYWRALVSPDAFPPGAASAAPATAARAEVPGVWNGQIVAGVALPGEGYATYKLKVLLPPEVGPLAVRIYDGQGSAYRMYWNGELAAYNGAPGRSAAEERPEYLPQTARVRRSSGEATVVLHISNHSHRNGGFQVPILLGSAERIFAARDRARTANAFLAGSLLIMALYHFGLHIYRRKDRETLWFAVMCLVITLRVLTSGERLLGESFRWVPWIFYVKLEYLSFYSGVPAMALFMHSLFPARFTRRVLTILLAISLPFLAAVIALPPALFSYTLPYMQAVIVGGCLLSIVLLSLAARDGQQGARLILAGLGVFVATVINDMIYYQFYIGPGYLTPLGLFIFTLAHAGTLARRVATAFNTSEELTAGLEMKVAERTRQLAAERDRTEAERARSDALLLNILPRMVAEELKGTGQVQPQHYASATVLFTDFVGFTRLATEMAPADLVATLHECFSAFDSIAARHGLEKLKTIGDSYMCAGGVPAANQTHAIDACLAGLEFLDFMADFSRTRKARGLPAWSLRIGVHTGPVTAGVIGSNKFAYDIWGDAVNTASRLESSGAEGRLNISSATYEAARRFFQCEYRGSVEAKGKGALEMYFVTAILPQLATDSAGRQPGPEFLRMRAALPANAPGA